MNFFSKNSRASLPIMIAVIAMFLLALLLLIFALGQTGDRLGAGYTGKMITEEVGGSDDNGGGQITCGPATAPTGPHTFPLARTRGFGGDWLANRCGGTGSGPHIHGGTDIMHGKDDHVPVYAVANGFIRRKSSAYIYLQSSAPGDKYVYFYQHLSQVIVSYNQTVTRGQLIGYSGGYSAGARGDHTHFSMIRTNNCTSLKVEVPLPSGKSCGNTAMAEREQIACAQTCLVNPISVLNSWR